MALAVPADHTAASAGMVAALAVRPGYTVPVADMADMAAAPADHTAASAGMVAALAVRPGYTVPVADMADMAAAPAGRTVASAGMVADMTAPHSAQKSIRHQLRQYLLLYSVHPCRHLPPM